MNLDNVKFDPKATANINYVKARCAIEENFKCRADIRAAKLAVIEHFGGSIKHPSEAAAKKGFTKVVVFPDNSRAKF